MENNTEDSQNPENKPSKLRRVFLPLVILIALSAVLITIFIIRKPSLLNLSLSTTNKNITKTTVAKRKYYIVKNVLTEKKFYLYLPTNFEKVFEGEIGNYINFTTSPPILSPNKKYLFVTSYGVIDTSNYKVLFKNKIYTSCAWKPESTGLICISSEDFKPTGSNAPFGSTRYRITDVSVTGEEKILVDQTIDYNKVDPSSRDYFIFSWKIIGYDKLNNEIVLFSLHNNDVSKYNPMTNQFSLPYAPVPGKFGVFSSTNPTAHVAYSSSDNKVYYIMRESFGGDSVDKNKRNGVSLIEVDLKSGASKKLLTDYDVSVNLGVFLSTDEKEIVYGIEKFTNDQIYLHKFNLTSSTDKEFTFTDKIVKSSAETNLVGFNNDESKFLVASSNDLNHNASLFEFNGTSPQEVASSCKEKNPDKCLNSRFLLTY